MIEYEVNTEPELWTSIGKFKLNLVKKVDIRKLDKVIAEAIL
ncbi:hypothetical protein ACRC6Q_12705 [Planococcus sp. SE5232]|nr:hypothetical protein [Planococcus sp. 4-30]